MKLLAVGVGYHLLVPFSMTALKVLTYNILMHKNTIICCIQGVCHYDVLVLFANKKVTNISQEFEKCLSIYIESNICQRIFCGELLLANNKTWPHLLEFFDV